MIPHCLQIKNFLSYGADLQVIDFKPHHLIYLSGKNGHGKSALLDAMTWAIWGVARKTTNAVKPDQGLLRLGATQMLVIFDFELSGQRYRVKREFIQAAGGKPLAYLEFGIVNEDGSVVALTDKTIRATQAVIEKTIRLDYESFTNSAFLRQGHANEFSQKSPKDRKEILGTILGLGEFELLKRRALDRAKEGVVERQAIMAVQESLAEQLKAAQDIELLSKQLKSEIDAIKKEDAQLQLETKQHRKESEQLAEQHKKYEQINYKKEQQKMLFDQQVTAMRSTVSQWRTVHAQQLKLPDMATLEKEKKDLSLKVVQFQKTMQSRLEIHAKLLQQKEALSNRKQAIEKGYQEQNQKLLVELERVRFERESARKAIADQQTKITALEKNQKQCEQKIIASQKNGLTQEAFATVCAQFEKRKNAYQQYVARGNWLRAELESLEGKQDVAQSDNPSCPLCEQNLSAARKKFLGNRFARQQKFLTHQLARIARLVGTLKKIVIDQHEQIEQQRKNFELQNSLIKESQATTQELAAHAKQLQEVKQGLEKTEKECAAKENAAKKKEYEAKSAVEKDELYGQYKKEVDAAQKALHEIVYDEKAHQAAQKKVAALEKQLIKMVELHQEVINQPKRMQEVGQLIIQLKEKKKQLTLFDKELAQLRAVEKAVTQLKEKERVLHERQKNIQERKEKAREQHGRIKTRQEQAVRLEKEQKKHAQNVEKLNKEIEDYQTISAAAGKDGIQALLIEEAIPEIEQEANALLSRLTNNQSQIFIESLRDLKRGGSKETLDINIADPSGIRPYEMFSGGEAFRIDFALRIAISKLLARRAGTALQTLIIDEGFGSQDEEGLSLIMDAIYKIQDDFEKVIVVSHLPGMHDQFPVHFVVKKRPNGSIVSVVEQG